MGGRGQYAAATISSRNPTISMAATPPVIQPTTSAAANANNSVFSATDNAPYHNLYNGRGYFTKQNFTIDQTVAIQNYVSPDPLPGDVYSTSQTMNYHLAEGLPLTENEKYLTRNLDKSMHNLGYNISGLTRYDHETFINKMIDTVLGTSGNDYSSFSESQLQSMLVGLKYGEKRYVSTSYKDFANADQKTKNAFLTRAVKIEYNAKASSQAIMPGNGTWSSGPNKGNKTNLDEVLFSRSGSRLNYEITGLHFDNSVNARYKGTQFYGAKRIVLQVEIS